MTFISDAKMRILDYCCRVDSAIPASNGAGRKAVILDRWRLLNYFLTALTLEDDGDDDNGDGGGDAAAADDDGDDDNGDDGDDHDGSGS